MRGAIQSRCCSAAKSCTFSRLMLIKNALGQITEALSNIQMVPVNHSKITRERVEKSDGKEHLVYHF